MIVKIIEGCIGCGLCESTCPDVFSMNASGVAEVIKEDVCGAESLDVQSAADGCPANVIVVE